MPTNTVHADIVSLSDRLRIAADMERWDETVLCLSKIDEALHADGAHTLFDAETVKTALRHIQQALESTQRRRNQISFLISVLSKPFSPKEPPTPT